jgi:hypothetical protein
MTAPKPSAHWGKWRNEIVTVHTTRAKARAKQTELDTQLRESKENDNGPKLP